MISSEILVSEFISTITALYDIYIGFYKLLEIEDYFFSKHSKVDGTCND